MLGGGACEEAGVAREQFETELAQRIGFKRGRFWKRLPLLLFCLCLSAL